MGAGVAGALLTLRLAEAGVPVDLFTGTQPDDADATSASGGLVRGYEPDPAAAALAAAGIAELRSDPRMRSWADFAEIGSVYVTPVSQPPVAAAVDQVLTRLPGSLRLAEPAELPLRGVPEGAVVVRERLAGFIRPGRLRANVLAALPGLGATVHTRRITAVSGDAVRAGAEGFDGYDAVVVAAGAWTRELVPGTESTTRQIQYGLYPVRVAGLPSFVDETSGLYGRPYDGGRMLFGLSSDRWGLPPEQIRPDEELSARVTACLGERLGLDVQPEQVVASFDCYTEPAGLRLRRVGNVLTFTGGSGGAAKTVLAASRVAARELVPVLEGAR
ncbi:FAD-dependent oxidoreductase [Labedaea rhizosphaerae]|uniref:Glycine/D-amino acid oxidase-like deaminating enzyme n=1 Tax=Labedaea rhizosphaerae TaxID=598644 RepID=A0A4R6S496_LABRH|nr:FAD-dependent oxidoreductase [Labedaea rhizosphaerae]TDP94054.1 glycine/D-amino acid oxidase-like deaminating enzyme [Labedaea rhizosphaerae]